MDKNISNQSEPPRQGLDMLIPILFGASAFQYLNAGCELALFDLLHRSTSLSKKEIAESLHLQSRAVDILLLGVCSLNLLIKQDESYRNAPVIEQLIAENNWQIFKDIVAFEQYIVYQGQFDFVESLKTNTNAGIKRIEGEGRDLYHRLSENPFLEKVFYQYMDSWTRLTNHNLLSHLNLSGAKKLLDVGGGTGINAIALAKKYPQLSVMIMEIPPTARITEQYIEAAGLSSRIKVHAGDMFADDFPEGNDCILFSHQLVIWTEQQNESLLQRAWKALPAGGKVIIFSSFSNDEGTGPLMAALDSVYFACLPAEGGMIYSFAQYEEWLKKAGFEQINRINCYDFTPHGLLIGTKGG